MSSLPEVVGDAAILVDPDQMQEVARALIELQEDPKLQRELIEKGYRNADRFSWNLMAARYAELIMKD